MNSCACETGYGPGSDGGGGGGGGGADIGAPQQHINELMGASAFRCCAAWTACDTSGRSRGSCWLLSVAVHVHAGSGAGGGAGGNADFGALQQHIDELTGERFQLLRGLDGQRAVTEALTAENQALVEDFNRQVSLPHLCWV